MVISKISEKAVTSTPMKKKTGFRYDMVSKNQEIVSTFNR